MVLPETFVAYIVVKRRYGCMDDFEHLVNQLVVQTFWSFFEFSKFFNRFTLVEVFFANLFKGSFNQICELLVVNFSVWRFRFIDDRIPVVYSCFVIHFYLYKEI